MDAIASTKKITSNDIRVALMSYYAPPSHRVFFEVSNDTGAKASRWIDAVAVGIWPSTGHEIVGIEIKVSRSDWQRELKEPAKAQSLMKYCTRWFLACPDGMVKPDELPATWGLLAYKDGAVRSKVQAKLLEPEPLTSGFMMAVLRNANAVDMEMVGKLVQQSNAKLMAENEARILREVERRARDTDSRRKRIDEMAAKLEAVTGSHPSDWTFDDAALGAAYRLLKATGLHEISGWGQTIPGILSNLKAAETSLASFQERFAEVASVATEKNIAGTTAA